VRQQHVVTQIIFALFGQPEFRSSYPVKSFVEGFSQVKPVHAYFGIGEIRPCHADKGLMQINSEELARLFLRVSQGY